MSNHLISDVINGKARLEINWEPFRELARNQRFTVLTSTFPPEPNLKIITNYTSGIQYPRYIKKD